MANSKTPQITRKNYFHKMQGKIFKIDNMTKRTHKNRNWSNASRLDKQLQYEQVERNKQLPPSFHSVELKSLSPQTMFQPESNQERSYPDKHMCVCVVRVGFAVTLKDRQGK